MGKIYLNDPNGLKETQLLNIEVRNPEQLSSDSRDFLCSYLIKAGPKLTFFAQNIDSHAANIATIIVRETPEIHTAVVSTHEIRWLKEMLEIPGFQPDSTHSNYHLNRAVESPTFSIQLAEFATYASAIKKTEGPAIFYVSHVSRFSGEMQNIEELYRQVRAQHPDSVLIVDGAQALGVTEPVRVDESCDVYLGMSSKFLGAEPNLGFAFFSRAFADRYAVASKYPAFDAKRHDKDLYSLWESLQDPLYRGDYPAYIADLKKYAVEKIEVIAPTRLFVPSTQSPGFLTLDFGSKQANEEFVAYADAHNIIVSDNANEAWSIIPAPKPLVRVGLSVRTSKADIDRLVELVRTKEKGSRSVATRPRE